jgi:hypothetical protein
LGRRAEAWRDRRLVGTVLLAGVSFECHDLAGPLGRIKREGLVARNKSGGIRRVAIVVDLVVTSSFYVVGFCCFRWILNHIERRERSRRKTFNQLAA